MRKQLAIIALTLLAGQTALAQATPESALCTIIKTQQQQAPKEQWNNPADYVPGIDVHGKEVTSADLNQPIKNNFEIIEIPVEINLIERFNLDINGGIELKPTVTNFRIHQGGRVEYGDQDITPQAYAICGMQEKTEEAAKPKEETNE